MPDQNPTVTPIVSKAQAITSSLNRNIEIFSLTPSTLLTLWEIDASVVMDEVGLKDFSPDSVFRFHNSINLTNTTIIWNGRDYSAAPIQAQGFEYSAKGSPPTPKLSLSVSDEGASALSLLKLRLQQLNDLTGVKVTRIRVFAKYIDGRNFETLSKQERAGLGLAAQGFTPDPNMRFEPDVYFIDRKSLENKSVIEFELGSIIDIEGVKIPGRIVAAKRCPFSYRGAGCLYESNTNRIPFIHGEEYNATTNAAGSILPDKAPPVANDKDESISTIIGGTYIVQRGVYIKNQTYQKGDSVFIQKDGIKYHFVANANGITVSPPNPLFWIADVCSKTINGCRLRYANLPRTDGIPFGTLNFGGFPATLTNV